MGILVGPTGKFIEYFSYFLTPDEMNTLGAQEKKTSSRECETIAVTVAFEEWANMLKGMQVIFCLDNDGSRFNLRIREIRGVKHDCEEVRPV